MLEEQTRPDEAGKRLVVCSVCGYARNTHWKLSQIHHDCLSVPAPGNALQRVIAEFSSGCPNSHCPERASQMNQWGVDGCLLNRDTIIGWLREAAAEKRWLDRAGAIAVLMTKPWFSKRDPYGSIFDEAMRRARAKGT